jgi:hypothetical protein
MPLNLLKVYNRLLDLASLNEQERKKSLLGIFNRDIAENPNFKFCSKPIQPTPADGQIKMETLFTHLTTMITNKDTRQRTFDMQRSCRLHWIRYHVEQRKSDNMLVFSVAEPEGKRTYIYDKDEKYVIVLEPLRNKDEYYLLTAYYLQGKDAQRDKMMKNYKRRLDVVL